MGVSDSQVAGDSDRRGAVESCAHVTSLRLQDQS